MNFITITTAIFLFMCLRSAHCVPTEGHKIQYRSRYQEEETTCDTNVCFVIDGTTDLSEKFFEDQKKLVVNVAKLLRGSAGLKNYAAVEYGISPYIITPFINDTYEFIEIIQNATQIQSKVPFLTGGINSCFSLLEREIIGEKVVVVIGSGRNTIGSSPIERSSLFLEKGGKIISVGVGENPDTSTLDAIAGGNNSISIIVPKYVWLSSKKVAASICS